MRIATTGEALIEIAAPSENGKTRGNGTLSGQCDCRVFGRSESSGLVLS
jgi:hypothetical protein